MNFMLSDDEIKATLLFKLHRRGNWGASHTAFENLLKGWNQSDLGKQGLKLVQKLAKELIRQGAIVPKTGVIRLAGLAQPEAERTDHSIHEEILY